MRLLLAVILVCAAGWSAYWFLGASREERAILDWLQTRHEAGWVVSSGAVSTRGFPNRFDTRIEALELADPNTGVAWTTPFLQLYRLSYEPNHIIAAWPGTQTVSTPNQRIDVTTKSAQASLVFAPGGAREVLRGNLAARAITLNSNLGWTAEIGELLVALRPSERVPGAVNFGVNLQTMRPANPLLRELAEMELVPDTLDRVVVDASVKFDTTLDRRLVEEGRPNPRFLDLHRVEIIWGSLELWLAGEVDVNAAGELSGEITVKAKNWREILELGVSLGWIPESIAGPLEQGLSLLAGLAGSKETLDAPLTLKNGRITFAAIPIGSAPKLAIR